MTAENETHHRNQLKKLHLIDILGALYSLLHKNLLHGVMNMLNECILYVHTGVQRGRRHPRSQQALVGWLGRMPS